MEKMRLVNTLRELAGRCFGRYGWEFSRLPSPSEVPEWSKVYAKSLIDRKAKPATWGKFYKDLVPYVFSPERWCVFELPNPMDKETQSQFSVVGRGSVRLRFERR